MNDIYAYTNPEIIAKLGARFREYRQLSGLTLREVAEKAGLSVMTIQKFESGTAKDVTMTTILRLLRVINHLENIETLLPQIPESPYKK
ncbi:MAG: helix-turn-helix domain-containing protein [Paludibacteraceae bacterium]|nr:helix-turn-helix domain-containing protein [Paludibacteraceae bacterium]